MAGRHSQGMMSFGVENSQPADGNAPGWLSRPIQDGYVHETSAPATAAKPFPFALAAVALVVVACASVPVVMHFSVAATTTTTTTTSTTSTTTTTTTTSTTTTTTSTTTTTTTTSTSTTSTKKLKPPKPGALYYCTSANTLGPVKKAENKGICMDDTTLGNCPEDIPAWWPNTRDKITSIRMFAPWRYDWGDDEKRERSWDVLKSYVDRNNAKVLIGTDSTCDEKYDAQIWKWTKELAKKLGVDRLMGLAIGNEMDLLFTKGKYGCPETNPGCMPGCLKRLWADGGFLKNFLARVKELDEELPGFDKVPVTSVWSAVILGGNPWLEDGKMVTGSAFFKNVTKTYGNRYVFAFNIYPYFDPSNRLDPGKNTCEKSLKGKNCFSSNWGECITNVMAANSRNKMNMHLKSIGKNPKTYKLWIGESGWSYPVSGTTQSQMKKCKAWNSKETFQTIYNEWLKWDLSTNPATQAADHAFYFTMRDALNFGVEEHFGLIGGCGDAACKL